MESALLIHRLQFAFTVTYHYLFPQLTMGLAPLIVILKTLAIRTNDETYDKAARFWAKIFGINFRSDVPLSVPTIDDGTGAADRDFEDPGDPDKRRNLRQSGPLLGQNLWHQLPIGRTIICSHN